MANDHRKRSLPFFALGAAFFVIGLTSSRTFLFVGLAFWLIGLMKLRPPRR